MSGVRKILRKLRRRNLILILERSVLSLVLPGSVSDGRNVTVSGDFLAKLEDGHADGHDEAEERKL